MFRVFRTDGEPLNFLTYNEFAAFRIRAAAQGLKPYYTHKVRVRGNYYINCYELRKTGDKRNEPLYT